MSANRYKKLQLVGFGLLLGLLLAEAVLWVHAAVAAHHVPRKRYADGPAATGVIRMAVLGGSTSNGSPYSDAMGDGTPGSAFNLLSVTGYLLENRYGCAAVEIENYAGPNWSAETTIEHYVERPGPKPDVLVLYTGQNETTRYYSPNMVPPPTFLSPLARLQSGSLLLRRLFTRQVVPVDQRYTGKFFSDNIIPSYERKHNLVRFKRSVERLIRHSAAEGIFLIIVIPQSNYLFPPVRSVYHGPTARKAEALRLFKQAWEARHVANAPGRALALLEQLREFCSFADLYYELGQLHYARGDVDAALPYLRLARETDGFPTCITPAYRNVLRELVEEYGVPHVDMDDLLRNTLGRPVPDYTSFLDDCHLSRDVYLGLSRRLIGVMSEHGLAGLDLPPRDLGSTPGEWQQHVGITPAVWEEALRWEARYHANMAYYMFCRLGVLKQARRLLAESGQDAVPGTANAFDEQAATVDVLIRAEEERMRKWVHHEGPMPIGAAPADEPPAGFGGHAGIETSQGDAFSARGEYAMAARHYRAALATAPDSVRTRFNLAAALWNLHQFEEAVQELERVVELDPHYLDAHRSLGMMLVHLKRLDEAVVQLCEAARLAPGDETVLREYASGANKLAWRLATAREPSVRDGKRAVELAIAVCRMTGYEAMEALDALAAAYAETGRFDDAVMTATRALEVARQYDNPRAGAIVQRLAQYEAGHPWREAAE